MPKLTKRLLDHATPQPYDYFLWDTMPGFGCRVWPSGKKTYLVQYRVHGRTRRATLGTHGVLTVDQARQLAQQLLAAVARGEDPATARRQASAVPTLAAVVERYRAEVLPRLKPATHQHYEVLLTHHLLPAFGSTPPTALHRAEVARWHHQLRRIPRQANDALRLLGHLWTLAQARWLLLPEDTPHPCRGIAPYPTRARERYLTADALGRLGTALDASPAQVVIRLLLLTGARVSEICGLCWDWLDLPRGTARLPDSKTAAKTLFLAPAALALIEAQGQTKTTPYVFRGRRPGTALTPGAVRKVWEQLRLTLGLDEVRLHDLRHTYASIGVGLGLSLYQVGQLLGHARAQGTERYAHFAPNPAEARPADW